MVARNNQLAAKNAVVEYIDMAVTADTVSDTAVDLLGKTVVGVITPTVAGGSVALTFQVSDDDSTFRPLKDKDNSEYTVTIDTTSTQYFLEPYIFAGVRYLKVETDASETETFILVTRPVA